MPLRVETGPEGDPQQADDGDEQPPQHHGVQAEHAYAQSRDRRDGHITEAECPRSDQGECALQDGGEHGEEERLQCEEQRIDG